jgi:ribonuclease inhibitor barstar
MSNIQKVVIEGAKIRSEADFHNMMCKYFDFGPYYGNNLNSFWDMLSSGELSNVTIIWNDYKKSKLLLGIKFDYIIRMFAEVRTINYENKINDEFDFFLE